MRNKVLIAARVGLKLLLQLRNYLDFVDVAELIKFLMTNSAFLVPAEVTLQIIT